MPVRRLTPQKASVGFVAQKRLKPLDGGRLVDFCEVSGRYLEDFMQPNFLSTLITFSLIQQFPM
jgi:hypothetical protein